MYHLTLTAAERHAINWIGNRYSHGNYLYKLLWVDSEQIPNGVDWDAPEDIEFEIPEWVAWRINDIGSESDFAWDCFAPALVTKLNYFCEGIV